MEIIRLVLTDHLIVVIVGIVFLTVGIIISKFKMYWLIAGLNSRPKKEIEKQFDVRYLEKHFGLFMLALGTLTIMNPIVWTTLKKENNIGPTIMIVTLTTVAFWFVFAAINKKKIYNNS